MPRSRTALVIALLIAACGGGGSQSTTTSGGDPCARYCSIMDSTCVGSDAQFGGLLGSCQSYCGTTNAWPAGTPGAGSGNSMACRNTHAILASQATNATDRSAHCGHAGPSGADTCGSWCENYCVLVLKNCTGANGAGLGFTDQPGCMAACSAFATNGNINSPKGNTVQCRIYYAGAASTAPVPYCGDAQVISSSTVGGTNADGACN